MIKVADLAIKGIFLTSVHPSNPFSLPASSFPGFRGHWYPYPAVWYTLVEQKMHELKPCMLYPIYCNNKQVYTIKEICNFLLKKGNGQWSLQNLKTDNKKKIDLKLNS